MRVRLTPSARSEFLEAIAFIKRDDPQAARRFYNRAQRSLRRLGEYAESGRRLPEFPDIPYREVIVAPYRFFYRVEGKTVWIVAVWHGAQLPRSPGS